MHNFGDRLYPEYNSDVVKKNASDVIRWMKDRGFRPDIDIFSGSPFEQEVNFNIIYNIIHELSGDVRFTICIPTPTEFVNNDELSNRVSGLIKEADEHNISLVYSFSTDGKFCDDNRPMKSGIRPEDHYDKVFRFAHDNNCGLHPMVSSKLIERWPQNFDWFIEQMKKYDISIDRLYLLEVRNDDWTKESLNHYSIFIRHLIKYFVDVYGKQGAAGLMAKNGFNILKSIITKTGRGMGCGIQNTVHIRMQDLAWVPCHRTMYPKMEYGKLVFGENGASWKDNCPELAVGIYSYQQSIGPYCEHCKINTICQRGCLGAQYEATGSLFTPAPSVCAMYHVKAVSFTKAIIEFGIYNDILKICNIQSINILEEIRNSII